MQAFQVLRVREDANRDVCCLQSALLGKAGARVGTFLGVDVLEWPELALCLETGLLGTCCASGSGRPSTSARMHSWYSGDFRNRV